MDRDIVDQYIRFMNILYYIENHSKFDDFFSKRDN